MSCTLLYDFVVMYVMDEAWKNVWYLTIRVSLLALKLCLLSMILFALHQVMIAILQYLLKSFGIFIQGLVTVCRVLQTGL